jgi:hypothetical protein
MAKPRIFISSTFYDLKQVRSSLEVFVRSLGFDPVLSEKGSIAYSPDVPLDESCYREAESCDVFVLIIGGRYGSEISSEKENKRELENKGFYDQYESITRKEYDSAIQRDIPAYVLIEKSVYSEYEIFKRNRENDTVKYASVSSVNVFTFIDYVLNQPRNSPVYQFELSSEIEIWLREQWAGLFRELIRTRADRAQLSSLSDQVNELSNVSTTLKRYLEEVVERVGSKEQAKEIISEEHARLADSRELSELAKVHMVDFLVKKYGMPVEKFRDIFSSATSLEDLAERLEEATGRRFNAKVVLPNWRKHEVYPDRMNSVRDALHLPRLKFKTKALKNPKPKNSSA